MECFIKCNKLLFKRNNNEKIYSNYDYDKYNVDKQILNDVVISNFYKYGDSIIYDVSVLEYLEKELYNIKEVEKNKYKITLKYDILMYLNLKWIPREGEEENLEYYVVNDFNERSNIIVSSNSPVAVYALENEDIFKINGFEYIIIDKEFFNKSSENLFRTCYLGKGSKIKKILVVSLIKRNKVLESVTYVVRNKYGRIELVNGYYYAEKNMYLIVDDLAYKLKDCTLIK